MCWRSQEFTGDFPPVIHHCRDFILVIFLPTFLEIYWRFPSLLAGDFPPLSYWRFPFPFLLEISLPFLFEISLPFLIWDFPPLSNGDFPPLPTRLEDYPPQALTRFSYCPDWRCSQKLTVEISLPNVPKVSLWNYWDFLPEHLEISLPLLTRLGDFPQAPHLLTRFPSWTSQRFPSYSSVEISLQTSLWAPATTE